MKIKIVLLTFLAIFNVFALFYIISPVPKIPDLPNSVKSNLPGDTTQITNVSAYYTNMSRAEVMDFYYTNFNGPSRTKVNYPPEKAKDIITDTIQSYYLEELVLPLKGSLYVNGFEWANDVFTKPEQRIKNKLLYNGTEYRAKITTRTFIASVPKRLAVFFFTEIVLIITILTLKSFLIRKKHD